MRKVLYILSIFNDEDVEWMLRAGKRQSIKTNHVLIQQGTPIDALYIVLEGKLGVFLNANEQIASLEAGEMVGEISFVDTRLPTATVKAIRDSDVFVLPNAGLHERLEHEYDFAARFYRAIAIFLAYRLRDTVGQMGYGSENRLDDPSELDDHILDHAYLAGTRFERIVKQLMG